MRDAILRSWMFEPWLALLLLLVVTVYLRGAFERGDGSQRWFASSRWQGIRVPRLRRGCTAARVACYLGGVLAIWIALASPLESFAPLLLSAHMAQHMLLTMVAAPLILLGEPFLPLLRGLPATMRRVWLGPFIAAPSIRRAGRWITHPVVAWITFTLILVAWHVPALYELALRDPFWHRVEHASLLGSAILFWWPIVQPFPSVSWWPRWACIPYLLVADLVNTVIAASFAFAPRVIYPTYAATAPALGVDALRDQAAAGALMWVVGAVAYLVPAMVILLALMRPKSLQRRSEASALIPRASTRGRAPSIALPQLKASPDGARVSMPWRGDGGRIPVEGQRRHGRSAAFDLLRVPLIGAALRRRSVRMSLRVGMLLLAAIIVVDGFLGPREAPMNLAGTLPWTHWRGLAVLLLLVGGNFLCMTCPFVLPRMVARHWQRWRSGRVGEMGAVVMGTMAGALPSALRRLTMPGPARRWPRALRNKWTAVALVSLWLVIYESFDLWASPMATAWVILAYFAAAFFVDAFASGGAFCKWVCPLGQFHFVQSSMSPLTIAVRDEALCVACTTHDCIRGNATHTGCELELFVPHKVGNMDCTFCLDCADACPHGNVGVLTQSIGHEWRDARWRSSLGRIGRRPDIATLALVMTSGAIANAAGMTSPVLEVMAHTAGAWSVLPRWVGTGAIVAAMLLVPLALSAMAACFAGRRRMRGADRVSVDLTWRDRYIAIAFATVPLGAAVWVVHFAFHLMTSWRTAGPVMVRAANDLGLVHAEPAWSEACCSHAPEWLLPANLLLLSVGTALSLWMLARSMRSAVSWLPGAIVIVMLWMAAAWVFFQPMDMRGTLGFEVMP